MNTVPVGRAPVDPGARLALLFGGTFDPPHRAHIELPAEVRDLLEADTLVYIPAARSPHKADGPVASAEDRITMLRAALDGRPRVAISTIELQRSATEPSYTADTLRALREELPATTALRLLIGADQAAAFHLWRHPELIAALAEPVVMLRTPLESADALLARMQPHWPAADLDRWRARIVPIPVLDAEATDIRRRLADNPDDPALAGLIPAPVLAYIRARRLYR